jgi:hypothetical protein
MRKRVLLSLVVMFLGAAAAGAQAPAPLPSGDFWFGAEYMLWWLRPGHLPPLVTTSSPASAGVLTQPDTFAVFGGAGQGGNEQFRSGCRFSAGGWVDCEHTWAIEADYFITELRGYGFQGSGNGGPGSGVLALPFFNLPLDRPDAQLISSPNGTAGSVVGSTVSQFQGAELYARYNVLQGDGYCIDVLVGGRYLQLDERVDLDTNLGVAQGQVLGPGMAFVLSDLFQVHSRFYGAQVGLRGEVCRGGFFADCAARISLGTSQQAAIVDGSTRAFTAADGLVNEALGGFYAAPSNAGERTRDRIAFAPEIGLRAGYQVNQYLRLFAAYNFLYLSSVLRAGQQFDLTINPARLPINGNTPNAGVPRPLLTFHETDFWAQGVSAGVEFRY